MRKFRLTVLVINFFVIAVVLLGIIYTLYMSPNIPHNDTDAFPITIRSIMISFYLLILIMIIGQVMTFKIKFDQFSKFGKIALNLISLIPILIFGFYFFGNNQDNFFMYSYIDYFGFYKVYMLNHIVDWYLLILIIIPYIIAYLWGGVTRIRPKNSHT